MNLPFAGRFFFDHTEDIDIMIIPPFLSPGDSIGIVATARKIEPGDLDLATQLLSSWGLKVVLGTNVYSRHHPYLAGSSEERRADLQAMINDPDIRAIIAARGGYGTTRILDEVDLSGLQKDPKWFVGFSDITALHLALFKSGVASVHGTMPVLFSKPDAGPSLESLGKLLMKGECRIATGPNTYNRPGAASGIMIGGNLSLLVDALGTFTDPDTDDKILFIEEIDEYLYKVDRMMTQLRRAGKLKNLKALVIGHMSDLKDSELKYGELVQDIVLHAVAKYDYPVAFNFPSGHENPNMAWVHGGAANLAIGDAGVTLSFDLKKNIG